MLYIMYMYSIIYNPTNDKNIPCLKTNIHNLQADKKNILLFNVIILTMVVLNLGSYEINQVIKL